MEQAIPRSFSLLVSSAGKTGTRETLTGRIMMSRTLVALCLTALASAHGNHDGQKRIAGPHEELWYNILPGDGGTQVSSSACQLLESLEKGNS